MAGVFTNLVRDLRERPGTSRSSHRGSDVREARSVEQSPPATPVSIQIAMTLDQIPDRACPDCDEPATKTDLCLEVPFSNHGKPTRALARVPGYACQACGFEAYDSLASVQALSAILAVVRSAGDAKTAERLTASVAAGKQHVAAAKTRPR